MKINNIQAEFYNKKKIVIDEGGPKIRYTLYKNYFCRLISVAPKMTANTKLDNKIQYNYNPYNCNNP